MNKETNEIKKIDIYTYFTAEQMGELLKAARIDTRSLVKHIKKHYKKDAQSIYEAIADKMPDLVLEQRVISRGPRKGMKVITFINRAGKITEKTVAETLTGAVNWEDFYNTVLRFSKSKSMTMVVLDDTDKTGRPEDQGVTPYKKHWIQAFLTRPNNSHIRYHYRIQTQQCLYDTQRAVDQFINQYNLDREEILTWTSTRFNDWYFNQKTTA